MREIPFENVFDALLNMFTSSGIFSSDLEDEKVITQICKSLRKGGKFTMDYVNKDFIIRNYLAEDIKNIKNGYVKINRVYNHTNSSHICTFDIFQYGKLIKQFYLDFRFYSVTELTSMLRRNGFKILSVYGGFNFIPLSFDAKNCIITAEKL